MGRRLRIESIPSARMFPFGGPGLLPRTLHYLTDMADYTADVDVVISTVGDMRHIGELVRNFLTLETKLKIHIWLAYAETDFLAFARAPKDERVTRIMLLNNPVQWLSLKRNPLVWSVSAALCAQTGLLLGKAPYFFYSHEDMMAVKKDFLSFLKSKLNDQRPMASFFQRHLVPHSGGMMVRKAYYQEEGVDFLPLKDNPFHVSGLSVFEDRAPSVKWVDAGEQYVYRTMEKGGRMYICECRGGKEGFLSDQVEIWKVTRNEVHKAGLPIDYAPTRVTEENFARKYPDIWENRADDNAVFGKIWWKAFDDAGDMVFLHRARGSGQRFSTNRGDFCRYLREFNREHHIS